MVSIDTLSSKKTPVDPTNAVKNDSVSGTKRYIGSDQCKLFLLSKIHSSFGNSAAIKPGWTGKSQNTILKFQINPNSQAPNFKQDEKRPNWPDIILSQASGFAPRTFMRFAVVVTRKGSGGVSVWIGITQPLYDHKTYGMFP